MEGFWGILIAVALVAAFIALRTVMKRFGIKRKCCGGKPIEKKEEKILESEPILEIAVDIGDLCCENCAVRVENALNHMDGVKAKASHVEKRAVLLLCREWSEAEIRATVTDCGFTAGKIQIRKF
jgi:copper chaperone CopZ